MEVIHSSCPRTNNYGAKDEPDSCILPLYLPVLGLQAEPTATGLMNLLFLILQLQFEERTKSTEVTEWSGGEGESP